MIETWILSVLDGQYLKATFLLVLLIGATASAFHAAIHKEFPRAALGWTAFIISSPILGPILYYYFGINRIYRKAHKLNLGVHHPVENPAAESVDHEQGLLRRVKRTGETLSYSPICRNLEIHPLNTGDEAYPEMLKAIDEAKTSVHLFSYILNFDKTGEKFVTSLSQAYQRGVEVRVLVDAVGSGSTLKKLTTELKKSGIDVQIFLPVRLNQRYANLRNHRKLLIVDGLLAFTGGLNIAEKYWPSLSEQGIILDFHFKIIGELVYYLQAAFVDDWYFVTGEEVMGRPYFHDSYPKINNSNYARVVIDGPGEDEGKMRWHFLSAINEAEKSIHIQTPYFLPDSGVSTALISAILRGVDVNILLPEKLDYRIVQWATYGSLRELLSYNCKLWLLPPPFDHSKLFMVDDCYSSIGSSNWDPRSLRLNFEMNVEVYSKELNHHLNQVFDNKKAQAKRYRLLDLDKRPYLIKVRDGFARMLSPYL